MRAGDRKTTTLPALKRRMSTAWNKVKAANHFSYDWKDLVTVQSQLDKVRNLVTENDSVVAINFPVSYVPLRVVDTKLVNSPLDGMVDAIILKNQHSPKRYLQVLMFDYTTYAGRTSKSPVLRFIAGLYDLAIRDAKLSNISRRYSFLRLQNTDVQNLTVQRYQDDKVLKTLSRVMSGINSQVYVPTTDHRSCKDCIYKFVCDWTQE
jgi:hypothetical protein